MESTKNGTSLESAVLSAIHGPGGHDDSKTDQNAICPRGVLSGIVLSDWESQLHGEGPDGSTPLAKETYAGHEGPDNHKRTSLQGIAIRAKTNQDHRFRNLYQYLNAEALMEAWRGLNKNAASGVDNVTAEDYQENLESNIEDLAKRLKTKRYRTK